MNELAKRVIAALVLATVGIGAMALRPAGYFWLVLLFAALLIAEYIRITAPLGNENSRSLRFRIAFYVLLATSAFILSYLFARFGINYLIFLLLYPVFIMLIELFNGGEKAFIRMMIGTFGLYWIVMPVCLSVFIVLPVARVYDPRLFIGVLFLVWANDIFAYFTGKYLGHRPLAKRISPKKTMEGAIGGSLASIAMAFALPSLVVLPAWYDWPALALIVSFFTITGDLLESLIKRNVQIKDSGSLIPGHGGLLDRFDSLLFSLIPVFIYLFIRNIIQIH